MAPGSMRVEKHEQIGGAITTVFTIVTLRLTWLSRDRLPPPPRATRRSTVSDSHQSKPPGASDQPLRHRDQARPPSARHRYHRPVECTTCPAATASDRPRRGADVRSHATPLHVR